METVYTYEYLSQEQEKFQNEMFNEIKKGLDDANDSEYAKVILLFPFLLACSFRSSTTHHDAIINTYEHFYKLGYSLEDAITQIIENIKQKNTKLEAVQDRANAVHYKREYYKLFGLFNIKHLPLKNACYNKDWELISERIFTYHFDLSLFWELFKRKKSLQESVSLLSAFYGTTYEDNVYIKHEPLIVWEDLESLNPTAEYIVRYIIQNNAYPQLIIKVMEYSKIFLDTEKTTVLKEIAENNNYEDAISILSDKLVTLEKELPKIEWLGTTKQLYDLFLALYQKNWIEDLNFDLVEKYFTESDNIRQIELENSTTFKDIKPNSKLEVSAEIGKISWLGTQKNLAELFIELHNKKWISPIPQNLIKQYFTKSKTIDQPLRPNYDNNGATYAVYTERYLKCFEKIQQNSAKN